MKAEPAVWAPALLGDRPRRLSLQSGDVGEYVIRGGRLGYERLQLLARQWMPTTTELLGRVGLKPGAHCLDVGCGGGEVTFEIARLVGPEGHVTGLDMDEVKLALGREAGERRGVTNVDFRVADVSQWNEKDAYDLVYARFLLQHLAQPLDLLSAMWAAVRPGGVLLVEDADFEAMFCDPPDEGFEFWKRSYSRVLELRGGDPVIGRKLHRYFREAGVPSPTMSVVQLANTTGEAKTLPLSTLEASGEAILAEGVATEGELTTALARLASFAADPETTSGSPRVFQVWASRPI